MGWAPPEKRGERKMHAREREYLHQLVLDVKAISRRLQNQYLQFPDLEPSLTNAQETAAKLEGWVNEMEWIVETDLTP